MSQEAPKPVIILCRDLLFGSKISASSKVTGVPLKFVRDPAKLAEPIDSNRLIADLNQPGYLEAATEWKQRTGGHVAGFAGHVQSETLAKAKAAGFDLVLTNGAFTAQLDTILRGQG